MTTTKATEFTKWGWGQGRYLDARAVFEFQGRTVVALATRLRSEKIEVYVVEDGLEMFAGYLSQVAAKNAPLAMAAIEALAPAVR